MKRLGVLVLTILSLVCAQLVAPSVLAVDPVGGVCNEGQFGTGDQGNSAICEAGEDSKTALFGGNGLVTRIAQIMVFFAAIIAVIMLIIGGVKYASSQGDSGKVGSAKQTIIYALAGLVIAVFAQAIVSFVLERI